MPLSADALSRGKQNRSQYAGSEGEVQVQRPAASPVCLAGRQGVSGITFRLSAAVRYSSLGLSSSVRSANGVLSSAFVHLPTFADSAGAMSLKMSLAANAIGVPYGDKYVLLQPFLKRVKLSTNVHTSAFNSLYV